MKIFKRVLLSICILIILLINAGTALAYQTQNVVVLVLCGVRGSEAQLDPAHQYIPNIWNNLRPLGMMNLGMQTFTDPTTEAGHFSILTGSWSEIATMAYTTDQYRSHEPTLFEYYLKGLNLPVGEAYGIIANENKLNKEDKSLHPLYGEQYKAVLVSLSTVPSGGIDIGTQQDLYDVMDTEHPSLIVTTFKGADIKAHSGDWDGYLDAIMTQDQIIYEVWNKIESDPFYAGKTTLFVIGDHGRHDDANGGFQSHGGLSSDGDRHVMFLAIGPDFKKNMVLNSPRKLIDLLPTIGELLGIQTTFADGRVMWELIKDAYTSDKIGKYNENYPSIAAFNNKSYFAYQRIPLLLYAGSEEIMQYSIVNGQKSGNTKLSGSFLFSEHPAVAASSSGLHAAYVGWIPTDGTYVNHNDWQQVYYRRSNDYGSTWTDAVCLSSAKPFWTEDISIDSEGAAVAVTWAFDRNLLFIDTSNDGGNSWRDNYIIVTFPRAPKTVIEGSSVYVAFYDSEIVHPEGGNRDIYITKSADSGNSWSSRIRLTTDPANDLNPDIAVSGDTVHLVWENNSEGVWQVYYMKSADGGNTWSGITKLTNSTAGAQKPKIETIGNKVLVAWEDYRNGKSELMTRRSGNGGASWSNEFKPINISGVMRNIDMTTDGSKFYIVWDDNRNGLWQVSSLQLQ